MGTRSLTVFKNENNEEIVVMYRQFDGYPEGLGKELAEFLQGMKIVNGIPVGDTSKIANGMECLSAQVIAHLKDRVGNIYLYPAKTRNYGEEYIYEIIGQVGDAEPTIKITDTYETKEIFNGTATELLNYIGEKE